MSTNRIEKKILLHAPLARVWRALSDSKEFGAWFGMRIDGPFAPGVTVRGAIVPTTVDEKVATAQKPYEGTPLEMQIVDMEQERVFSYRWHPGAVDPQIDYSMEPTTLVTFTLEQTVEGVMLTVVETGFDQIPLERRAKAFAQNQSGWEMVLTLIEKYVDHA